MSWCVFGHISKVCWRYELGFEPKKVLISYEEFLEFFFITPTYFFAIPTFAKVGISAKPNLRSQKVIKYHSKAIPRGFQNGA